MAKIVRKKDGRKEIKLDFGIGKLSLGGIFEGLEKLMEFAQKAEEAGGELRREGTIKGLGGREDVRGVYGFTIRTGLGGKGKWRRPSVTSLPREPIVDVFDEKDCVVIVAELPGVSKEDIKLDVKEDIVTLEASDDGRKFAKQILLPSKVDEKSKEISFKNGVLEVKLKKQKTQ